MALRGKGQRIRNTQIVATPIFETGFNTPARIVGVGKNAIAYSGDGPFGPGEVAHWFSLP